MIVYLKYIAFIGLFLFVLAASSHGYTKYDIDMLALSKNILIGTEEQRQAAVERLIARDNTDMIPSLVLLMRIGGEHVAIQRALRELTNEQLTTWRDAMNYQQLHPEIVPHASYYDLKRWYWQGIDANFLDFFKDTHNRDSMRIRFEEIVWGGALVDSIPALDNPILIAAEQADYLLDSDLVFGIQINGDVRAYPLRIMGWHEMVNDVIGGEALSLAYCTLCGTGILFETELDERKEPFVFGSSGLLYRSNKLMFDRQTKSLWNQFTGEPVVGPLAHSGIALKIRPMVITTWGDWLADNPTTKVLSLETGFIKNYDSGVTYKEYFASPDLMFPAVTDQSRLRQKEYVFGVRVVRGAKAWPLSAFSKQPVINDKVGATNVVLIGDSSKRSVRAYERGEFVFSGSKLGLTASKQGLKSSNQDWQITEVALIGPNQEKLPRLPGHVAYWFAWDGYLGSKSELYQASD